MEIAFVLCHTEVERIFCAIHGPGLGGAGSNLLQFPFLILTITDCYITVCSLGLLLGSMAYNYGVKGILGAYGIVCMRCKFRAQQILGLRGKSPARVNKTRNRRPGFLEYTSPQNINMMSPNSVFQVKRPAHFMNSDFTWTST